MDEPVPGKYVVDEAQVSTIASFYFNPDAAAKPRDGFHYGDNPYKRYQPQSLDIPDTLRFFTIHTPLREADVFPDSWIQFKTESGAVYIVYIMEKNEDNTVLGVGRVERPKEGKSDYIVGQFRLPNVGEEVYFIEYAHVAALEELQNVRYVDPLELKKRIEERIRQLFIEQGNEWMNKSVTGIRNQPFSNELKPLETTKVTSIELGL